MDEGPERRLRFPSGQRPFQDRRDAGQQLAAYLDEYKGRDTIVLALPRGGVPVGYEVARALNAPLDVFIARKLGAPIQPELGIGAIAPGGTLVLDAETIHALGISQEEIDAIVERESGELERRLRRFRGDRPMPDVRGKTVILVDDGLATGVTASAAVRALRQMEPAEVVLAVPVCPSHTAEALGRVADRVVCAIASDAFGAVGLWYDNFEQTTDEEVVELLQQSLQSAAVVSGAQATSAAQPARDESASPTHIAATIPSGEVSLQGDLHLPPSPRGIVLFAHGSGSSRHSSRNRFVAKVLQNAGFATLLMDLLTEDEERAERETRHLRFDIGLLAGRLGDAIEWLTRQRETADLPIGLFGASTGAAAALIAAAERPQSVRTVVSRGGRPDLAGNALPQVKAPTLLIVGGADVPVIPLNEQALARIEAEKEMVIVPRATHLFEEPGTLEEVARLAADWFSRYLATRA